MMLFGNKATFAIEAVIEPGLQPPSTSWGRMRIWCADVSIGNIEEEHCGLDNAFDEFRSLVTKLDGLWSDEFEGMTDLELWNLLDGLLFGYHGDVEIDDDRTLEQMDADSSKYGKFVFLTNWGEPFDNGGKSFLFHHPEGRVKILNRRLPFGKGISLSTSKEAFCSAIQEAASWFDQQRIAPGGTRRA
jgi:hypothetical protein